MADEQIVTSIVAKADLSSLVSEVHRATASLQQLQRELNASNRSIASATKVANNLFRDSLIGSGMYSSHFVNLQSDVDKFGKNLDAGRLKLKDYFSTFRTHLKTSKGLIRELAQEQVMLQNSILQPLGRNAQGLMQYNVMIPRGLDLTKNKIQLARMEMQIMNRALSEGATSLINWGKNTQWAGRQLTVGLTVPLTMFGAQAAKAFREADQELTRLTKVYGDIAGATSQELTQIRKEVISTSKELSSAMGVNFKETIGLAADIAATGQKGNELLSSLKETTRLAVLGEVDRAEAMKATLAIQTAFKSNTQELTETINFLNAVENQTSTTLNDLVEAIPKAGTVVKQLGGDVQDLALYLTAMREGGVNASEGANALKSGLASMINPTKQTIGLMSDFGIDIMGMVQRNTGNTTGMILELQKALDGLDPLSKARALEQMFGKFQFARMAALFNNLGKEGSQTLQVMKLMNSSANELAGIASRELGMVTESASGKYKRAIEGLRASLADVGEEFLGVATKFLNAFTKVLDFFSNLPEPIKKAVTYLGGFTAVIGPIIMLTGVLANFFGYITKGIVSLKAFFQGAKGWKMLTPEIIAAQKASELVEKSFYSDAKAAEVLHGALTKLVSDYMNLQGAMAKSAIPINPAVATVGGSTIMSGVRRVVDPNDPYSGDINTRAMSHINPRDINNPATFLGGVPGAIPVNQKIGRTPQIYMQDRLPDVPGVTTVHGVSTGIVSGEAARYHALLSTLAMQTEAEVATLKKTISLGGTVSSELLDTFDDILPITSRLADNAATKSAAIVAELRAGKMSVDQAKAEIIAINTQLESSMRAEISAYAASRGRTIDFTKAPLMQQPVVDANGQFTLRDLYKKEGNRAIMEEFGRLRGVRTFGAPYSIQTTRLPRFNEGGNVESFGPSKTQVSGPSSIGYDDRLGSIPVGGYVLNQSASLNPMNRDLVSLAPYTYSDGGEITAALTPKETVYGPNLHRIPGLYDALEAANNGYNFGGQIMRNRGNYGEVYKETPAYYKKQLGQLVRFIKNPLYEDSVRMRMVMLDAAELMQYAKMPKELAVKTAYDNFNSAKIKSNGNLDAFIKQRIAQVKSLEKKYPDLKHPDRAATRSPSSSALNRHIYSLQKFMSEDPRFANVAHELQSMKIFDPTKLNTAGVPYLQNRKTKEGVARGHLLRHEEVGYATRGHMGVAAVIDAELNSLMNRLDQIKLRGDVIHLTQGDAEQSLKDMIKRAGMSKMTTLDDIAIALTDPGSKFPSKKELELYKSGKALPLRANPSQKESLRMLLEAITKRKKWVMVPRGRPPIMTPVLASFNAGGNIPGGLISRGRSGYGLNPMSLLTPEKMLGVLRTSKELSSKKALGEFAGMSPVSYSHQVAPSSGKSYPIPGVSGLYKNDKGELVFFKGVPNEISAKAEIYGTRMAREVFGLDSPNQTIKTILNPFDPTRKSKLLGLESPFDTKFAIGGTKFTEDQMIRQTIASLLMGNKDLSKSNVFGNVLADVGPAGVFPRASMNTAFAESMNSMEKQAMINLLAVRGGARKDFAYNTAPIARGMSPRQYGSKMRSAMNKMHPKLKAFINSLPESDRAPYMAILARLEDGMKVNWSKYQPIHANPAFNKGGGVIVRGRGAYGPKKYSGSPARIEALRARDAARAERERAIAESKRRQHSGFESKAVYSGALGRESTTPINTGGTMTRQIGGFYNPAAYLRSMFVPNITMPANIPFLGNTAAIANIPRMLKTSLQNMATTIKDGANALAVNGLASAKYAAASLKTAGASLLNGMKSYVTDPIKRAGTILKQGATHDFAKLGYYNATPGMLPPHMAALAGARNSLQRYIGPIGLTAWAPQTMTDGSMRMHNGQEVLSRKTGPLGFRREQIALRDTQTGHITQMSAAAARTAGLGAPTAMQRFQGAMARGGTSMGMNMGMSMAGMAAGSALMAKGQTGLGMAAMVGGSMLPMMLPQIGRGIAGVGKGLTAMKGAFTSVGVSASTGAKLLNVFRVVLSRMLFVGPLAGIAALTAGLVVLIKKMREWNKDAQLRFGMNAKAAQQAGIQYTSLADKMKLIAQRQLQLRNAGKSGMAGISGLNMSMEELKKAKEFAQENLSEYVSTFKRANSGNIAELAANVKAQFVASGMSVDEANKKIMGMIAAAGKGKLAINVMTSSAFTGIKDAASAAEFSVKNLSQALKDGNKWNDQYKTKIIESVSSVIDLTDKAILSISQQKNATGQLKGEYEALVEVTKKMKAQGFDTILSPEAFSKLPIELQQIASQSDTIAGIYAKWRLYVKGVQVDLKGLSSETAQQLDKYLTAFGAAQDRLVEEGKLAFKNGLGINAMDSSFKKIGHTMQSLQSIIDKTGREAALAQQKATQAAEDQNQKLQDQIDLIREAADAKLKALDATEKRESYEIQIQKARLDYQDAIAKGDFQAAERARLDLIQLQKSYQAEQAKLAIQEEAAAKEKALQARQKKIAEEEKKRQREFQDAQNEAARAQEAIAKIQNYSQQYKDLLMQKQTNEFITDPTLKLESQKQTDTQLKLLIKEIQDSAMKTQGQKGYDIAGDIKKAFGKFFDASGNPLSFGSIGTRGAVTSANQIANVINKDMSMLQTQATLITGGTTIEQLRAAIVAVLGGNDTRTNATSTPAPQNTGKVGGPSEAATTTNERGERVLLKDGVLEAPMSVFYGGVKTASRFKVGQILTIGKGKTDSVLGLPSADPTKPKTSGAVEVVVVDPTKQKIQYRIKYVDGGAVSGPGTGTSDSIPAMLSNGEYVINAASASRIGYGTLDQLNRYAMGGIVGKYAKGTKDGGVETSEKRGTVEAMVDIAKFMVGYVEGNKNRPWYRRLTDTIMKQIGDLSRWCGLFITWAAKLAGVNLGPGNVIGTESAKAWYMQNNRWSKKPQKGDMALMWTGKKGRTVDHIGLVLGVNGRNMTTLEGNTGVSSQNGGGGVAYKVRSAVAGAWGGGLKTIGFGKPYYKGSEIKKDPSEKMNGDIAPHYLANSKDYSVNRGDTLFGIARKFGVSLNSIMQANPQLMNNAKYMGGLRLFKGTEIKVPRYATGGTVGNPPRRMYSTAGPVMGNVTIGDIVVNAAPGMDERALAKAAAQEVFAVISNRKLQMGQGKTSSLNRMVI